MMVRIDRQPFPEVRILRGAAAAKCTFNEWKSVSVSHFPNSSTLETQPLIFQPNATCEFYWKYE